MNTTIEVAIWVGDPQILKLARAQAKGLSSVKEKASLMLQVYTHLILDQRISFWKRIWYFWYALGDAQELQDNSPHLGCEDLYAMIRFYVIAYHKAPRLGWMYPPLKEMLRFSGKHLGLAKLSSRPDDLAYAYLAHAQIARRVLPQRRMYERRAFVEDVARVEKFRQAFLRADSGEQLTHRWVFVLCDLAGLWLEEQGDKARVLLDEALVLCKFVPGGEYRQERIRRILKDLS